MNREFLLNKWQEIIDASSEDFYDPRTVWFAFVLNNKMEIHFADLCSAEFVIRDTFRVISADSN